MINTLIMTDAEKEFSRLLDEKLFYGFISDSFDSVAGDAPMEDLARWAFGDLAAALEAYQTFRKSHL